MSYEHAKFYQPRMTATGRVVSCFNWDYSDKERGRLERNIEETIKSIEAFGDILTREQLGIVDDLYLKFAVNASLKLLMVA